MSPSPTDWKYCQGCVAKGAIPHCPVCLDLNGRDMTPEEEATMYDDIRAANARTFPATDDWWKDVPFQDDTTPRQRSRP